MGSAASAVSLALACLLSACGGSADGPVLAEVGDTRIRAEQLRRFEERLAESLRAKEAGIEGRLQHLQTLIDKEILIQEAAAREWDRDPELRRKLDKEWAERVVNEFFRREVDDKITLEERDIHDHYLKTGRNRAVMGGKIVVESREAAEEIVRLLQDGADFGELACERSTHRPTAEQGGQLTGYALKDQMPLHIMQDKVFPLQKGEISEPIPMPSGQFGIFKVMDEKPVPLDRVRSLVEGELHREKASARSMALGQRLQETLDLRARDEGLRFLAERLAERGYDFSEDERTTVLYEFDGGAITVGEFVDQAQEDYQEFSEDVPEHVRRFAQAVLVPRALVLQAARDTGIDREAEIVDWFRGREEERLLSVIRKKVTGDVLVDDAEARRFYAQNLKIFVPKETLTVDEVLVETRAEALSLKDRIERGEDLRALAEQHTLRSMARPDSGRFHLHHFQRDAHQALFEAAQGAEAGALIGPIEVGVPAHQVLGTAPAGPGDRYYSVFRIVESTLGAGPDSFAEVAGRARAMVLRQKRDRAFFQFLAALRQQYEPQVKVYEENLRALVEQEKN